MDPGTLGVDLCALGFHLVGLEVDFGFSASESLCSGNGSGCSGLTALGVTLNCLRMDLGDLGLFSLWKCILALWEGLRIAWGGGSGWSGSGSE